MTRPGRPPALSPRPTTGQAGRPSAAGDHKPSGKGKWPEGPSDSVPTSPHLTLVLGGPVPSGLPPTPGWKNPLSHRGDDVIILCGERKGKGKVWKFVFIYRYLYIYKYRNIEIDIVYGCISREMISTSSFI